MERSGTLATSHPPLRFGLDSRHLPPTLGFGFGHQLSKDTAITGKDAFIFVHFIGEAIPGRPQIIL